MRMCDRCGGGAVHQARPEEEPVVLVPIVVGTLNQAFHLCAGCRQAVHAVACLEATIAARAAGAPIPPPISSSKMPDREE